MSAKNKLSLEMLEQQTVKSEDGCWLFTGARLSSKHPYGRIRLNGGRELVHRLSWEMHRGPIPNGMFVLHTCANHKDCWNPDHLYLGKQRENAMDCAAQDGFNHKGEHNGQAKLTDSEVRELRGNLCGFKMPQVAEMYGITTSTLRKIRRRASWIHIQ